MKHVYLLQSITHPDQRYVGLTSDIEKRLAAHNSGQSFCTAKFRIWKLITSLFSLMTTKLPNLRNISNQALVGLLLTNGSGRAVGRPAMACQSKL
jgi:hypothetical protein